MNEIVTKLLASTAAVALAAFGPATFVSAAFAQSPQGASVAAGSIAVTRQGATTVITQNTNRGIIDWRSFSIGAQEAVRFDQPGRSSVTLNRVTGAETSRIDGNLSATGQVWLSNPNGVLIGPSGQINVGGLLATTGRIDATEFLRSGRAAIDQIGKDAAIVNSGTIIITEGGYAALAAASIRNEGVIAARAGSVALGSGRAATVDFTGDKLITFQVAEPLTQAPATGDALITNGGTIAANGGVVLMSARAAKGVMDNVVNLKGHVVANTVRVDGGTVSFGDGGIVQVSGKIDASNAAGMGGSVAVLGEKVGLMDGASIDASGAFGGGTVLVGGDWQGKGSVQNSQFAYVAPTATINVDATMAGDGGMAVVWAEDSTRFQGSVSARGGVLSGNGGKVETSGKRALEVASTAAVTTIARNSAAKAGVWLLDPVDITISTTGGAMPGGSLYSPVVTSTITPASIGLALMSTDVTIQTSSGSGGAGDITFDSGTISYSDPSPKTLTMLAYRHIDFASGTQIVSTGGALTVKLYSGATAGSQASIDGAIQLTDSKIITNGGSIELAGGPTGNYRARSIVAGGAFVTGVTLAGTTLNAGAGAITIMGEASSGFSSAGGAGVNIINQNSTNNTSTVTASGGITIEGWGAAAAIQDSVGVTVANFYSASAKSLVSGTGGGTVSITGQRGGASGGNHRNVVFLRGEATTDSGALAITGSYTGGSGGTSIGVALESSNLTTNTGKITVIGTGASSGTANVGIKADFSSSTTILSATGNGGEINLKTMGGTGTGGDITLGNGTTISYAGSTVRTLKIEAEQDITLKAGATISLLGATHNILLNSGVTGASQGAVGGGIVISSAKLETAGGSIALVGGVGGAFAAMGSSTMYDLGLSLRSGVALDVANLDAGAGSITIRGNARPGLAGDYGVGVQVSGTTSTLSATGGITVIGTGGDSAVIGSGGVNFPGSAIINGGAGGVTITGTGGTSGNNTSAAGVGIFFQYSTLNLGGGNLTMTGTGGANSTAGSVNPGILISTDANINGSGTMTFIGTGGSGSVIGGRGVAIDTNAKISATGSGAIQITGVRGAAPQSNNVYVGNATLSTAGGNLTLTGTAATGGGGPSLNHGVVLGAAVLSTTNGAIQITGVGANGGGAQNHGILLTLGSKIEATGTGEISLIGTRGPGDNSRNVISVGSSGNEVQIKTLTGALKIDGSAVTAFAPASSVDGVYLDYTKLETNDGAITLKGLSGATTLGSNGVSIYRSSIKNVGASTSLAEVKLTGDANGAAGNDIYLEDAVLAAPRSLILQADTIGVNPGTTSLTTTSPGATAFVPRSNNLNVSVDNTNTFMFGSVSLNILSYTNGDVAIGSTASTGSVTYSGSTLSRNLKLISGTGGINFTQPSLDAGGGNALQVQTDGTVNFAGSIGATTSLFNLSRTGVSAGATAKTTFDAGVTDVKSSFQSYSGPVELTAPTVTFNSTGAVTFNGPVDSASTVTANHSDLVVVAGSGVTFGNNFGLKANQALKSFTSGAGTQVTFKGTDYVTDGTQSYGNAVLLANDAKITAGGAVTFDGNVNTALSAGAKALTVTAASAAFGASSTVGGLTPLSGLTLSVTNTAIALPSITAQNLTVSTGGGAITQVAGKSVSISGQTTINSTGSVTLNNAGNDFNKFGIIAGAGSFPAIFDSTGSLEITGATIGSGGNLTLTSTATGSIIQSGAISATILILNDANVVVLDNPSNSILSLSASLTGTTKSLNFKNSGNLSIATVTASTATLGATNISGATTLDIAAGPLTLAVTGGSLTNVSVNSLTGTAAALGGNIIVTTPGGSINVNGVSLTGPPIPPPASPTPTVATVATVVNIPTIATVATVASVPTVATVATVASVATVLNSPTTPSVASIAATTPVPTPAALFASNAPATVTTILNQVLPPTPNFTLVVNTPLPPVQRPSAGAVSAQSLVGIVTATPPGAFIPPGAPFVTGTGAPLASAPTIKVDAADTGGANGQVIAFGGPGVVGGPGGPGGSGDRTLLPGLLSEIRSPRASAARADPPLAQQPSQMNEEPFLD